MQLCTHDTNFPGSFRFELSVFLGMFGLPEEEQTSGSYCEVPVSFWSCRRPIARGRLAETALQAGLLERLGPRAESLALSHTLAAGSSVENFGNETRLCASDSNSSSLSTRSLSLQDGLPRVVCCQGYAGKPLQDRRIYFGPF